MKKISIILIMFASLSILISCGRKGNAAPLPKNITEEIISELSDDSMIELTEERVNSYYDIDLDKLEDYSIYIEGSGGFSDEVAVFKVENPDNIEDIKTSISDRIKNQTRAFEGYNAKELAKIKDSLTIEKENYILFVISENNDRAEEIFQNSFK